MMEAGVVIGSDGNVVFWHAPDGRHGGALPDDRRLWDVLWDSRHELGGFAHSHPGSGIPQPSHTDLTTFAAIEAALGCRLVWWIVSSDRMSTFCWMGPGKLDYGGVAEHPNHDPPWVLKLRELSEISTRSK